MAFCYHFLEYLVSTELFRKLHMICMVSRAIHGPWTVNRKVFFVTLSGCCDILMYFSRRVWRSQRDFFAKHHLFFWIKKDLGILKLIVYIKTTNILCSRNIVTELLCTITCHTVLKLELNANTTLFF